MQATNSEAKPIPVSLLGKREAEQPIQIEFDSSAVIAEEEAAKSRKETERAALEQKSFLNSTADVTKGSQLQMSAANLFGRSDDELMHAQVVPDVRV